MSEYNVKNYTEQGGAKTVIGGTLEFKEGSSVTGLEGAAVLTAAGATLGGVKADAAGEGDTVEVKIGPDDKLYVPTYPAAVTPADNQANSVATTVEGLVTDFNALLLKLQIAGLMGGSMG